MPLFKAQVMYVTAGGVNARATLVLYDEDEKSADARAREAVQSMSAAGVREIRKVVMNRNSLDVEFLGRQPE